MTIKNSLKLTLCAGAMLLLAACATSTTPTAEKVAEAETMKAVSEELSQTNKVAKSEDGNVICKREAVVGSNFKRKVCATAEQWKAMEESSRATTADIQRSAGPGVTN